MFGLFFDSGRHHLLLCSLGDYLVRDFKYTIPLLSKECS